MNEAKVNGELIQARPGSPEVATCPVCGGEVHKRKRKANIRKKTYCLSCETEIDFRYREFYIALTPQP